MKSATMARDGVRKRVASGSCFGGMRYELNMLHFPTSTGVNLRSDEYGPSGRGVAPAPQTGGFSDKQMDARVNEV